MTTTTHPAEILVERLHPDAKLPVRATEGDAGADLHAAASAVVYPGVRGMIGTGIAVTVQSARRSRWKLSICRTSIR